VRVSGKPNEPAPRKNRPKAIGAPPNARMAGRAIERGATEHNLLEEEREYEPDSHLTANRPLSSGLVRSRPAPIWYRGTPERLRVTEFVASAYAAPVAIGASYLGAHRSATLSW
jgi:hypothetical protein